MQPGTEWDDDERQRTYSLHFAALRKRKSEWDQEGEGVAKKIPKEKKDERVASLDVGRSLENMLYWHNS